MASSVINEIKDKLSKIAKLKNIKTHYDTLIANLETAYKELEKMDLQLDKELEDVEKLEKLSIQSMFYKVLGGKEEQLEKERQEYLKLSLQHSALKKDIELLEYEKEVLSKKLKSTEALENRLEKLKVIREKEIKARDPEGRAILVGIYSKIDENNYRINKIKSVIATGNSGLKAVRKVIKHLKDAVHWGKWDMTASKSRYYDHMKHGAIDDATDAAYRAKNILRGFNNELEDLNLNMPDYNLNVHVEGSGGFMDVFFDNLISDWIIQKRIENVLSNVKRVEKQIPNIIAQLDDYTAELSEDITNLEKQKDKLLTT